MQTTGFIGLGHMGGALARRLAAAGFPLVVHDLSAAACASFQALGATVGASARDVADRAGTVFLCLPSVEAAQAVAKELATGSAVRVVVETSTVGPASVRDMAAMLATRGIALVDAPVSGGPKGAEAGTLSVMHAGAAEHVATVRPQLQALAGKQFDVGDRPGLAQVCKLVNNAISAAAMVASCEGVVLGVQAGLDAGTLVAAINAGSGRNAATLDKFPKSILPGTFDYGGPLGLMLKDLSLFIDEAGARGLPAGMAQAAFAGWSQAAARVGPEADYSELIRPYEDDAGVQVRWRAASSSLPGNT
ncbi:NAD(P)-dependent oxidoreductase [Ramlibacter tataouinensis]|uniref:NAD(P)-dependent oxidoreductase n=1 Tax=Ramlibacter tataouinensis TaxID=94132 RepID=UPI0022F3EC2F|nr:NAD(P)-dependent oxidoreductase [Ramlibacter tataouinensis]WBY02891.1 NAD(P)-dependent oxidoreductase [Ramlibacter tataouinensis]